jgi:hypothetical protein
MDIHRMTAVTRVKLPLLKDFGNANSSARGSRASKPVILVRRAPKMWILLSSRRTSPFVFGRTQNNQAFHVDTAAGDGRSSARTSPCLGNPPTACRIRERMLRASLIFRVFQRYPPKGNLLIDNGRGPLWVKRRKPHSDYMFSGLHPIADLRSRC